jgi:hypothetical protein
MWCTNSAAVFARILFVDKSREAEVSDLDFPVIVDQDIRAFQVAVDNIP